jgi:hypothetical protein
MLGWACACGACLSAAFAGGPPYTTDDPVPVDYRHWELYLASQHAHGRFGQTGTAPHVEVNYGLAPDVQLHVIAPFSYAKFRTRTIRYGLGDVEIGAKYRFVQETEGRPQIGVFPHVELPTGSSPRGLGGGRAQIFLPVWLQKSWGSWTTYGGGGYTFNPGPGRLNYWTVGWEVQRDLSKAVTLGAEIFASTPSAAGERSRTSFNLGTVLTLGPRQFILFSAGRDIRGPSDLTLYVAYQMVLGPRENKGR